MNGLIGRVFAGALYALGLLNVVYLLMPGSPIGTGRAEAVLMGGTVLCWGMALWILQTGLSLTNSVCAAVIGDLAIWLGASAFGDPEWTRLATSLYAAPSVLMALQGSVRLMAGQAGVSLLGVALLLAPVQLTPGMWATRMVVAALVTVGPALAVLTLRRALDEALLREHALATTDPLTRAANRRGLDGSLPDVLAAARRQGLPVGVALLDVDHFKQVNDTHGYQAGDVALARIADIVRECVRDGDLVCRLGGERFAVVAAASPEQLAAVGERIRREVAERAPYRVTVSVGATWSREPSGHAPAAPQSIEEVQHLVEQAADLLSTAKQGGRNRVTLAG